MSASLALPKSLQVIFPLQNIVSLPFDLCLWPDVQVVWPLYAPVRVHLAERISLPLASPVA